MSKNRNRGQSQASEEVKQEEQAAVQGTEAEQAQAGQEVAQALQAVAEAKQEEAQAPAAEPVQETVAQEVAAPAPEPVQAPAPVAAPAAPVADAKAAIAEYCEKAAPAVKSAFQTLETYIDTMAPNKIARPDVILTQQKLLWSALRSMATNGDDFSKGWRLVIRLFKEHKDGVFNAGYVFRGFEGIVMDSETIKTFQSILNLLIVSAGVVKPSEVRKVVSLDKSVSEQFFTEEARARIFAFYN